VSDQAAALRQIAQWTKGPADAEAGASNCEILAVTSGKGGVGKSNVTINLAIAMARAGRKTLMLDADIGAANIDVLLGLDPRRNLHHVIEGGADLFEILIKVTDNLYLLPGASGISQIGEMPFDRLKQFREDLIKLESLFDCILADTSAGVGPTVVKTLRGADRTLLICGPEPTALVDAYALCKVLFAAAPEAPVAVVVNNVSAKPEADEVYAKLSVAVKHFLKRDLTCLGFVIHDENLAKGVIDQRPFMFGDAQDGAAANFIELAEKLARAEGWAQGKGVRQLFNLMLEK